MNAGRSGSRDAHDARDASATSATGAAGASGAPGDHGDADTDDEALTGDSVVELPLEDVLDLHGFPPRDVREIVLGYLDDAIAAGFSAVRIVHGRGMGVQRDAVRALLSRDGRVAEFSDAPESQGGRGATLVRFARVAR